MRLAPGSRATLSRFGRTVAVVAATGVRAWCWGLPSRSVMALACNYASLMALLRSHVTQESLTAPHLGRIDEAAWLFLLGHVLRTAPHG